MNPLFLIDLSISDSLKNVRKSVLIYESIILRDEFGFGKGRMQKFYDRFMLKTEMVLNHVTDFPEIRKTLEKELGYEINKRIGITGVELFRKKLGITLDREEGVRDDYGKINA